MWRFKSFIIFLFIGSLPFDSFSQITETDINNATDIVNGVADLLAPTEAQLERRAAEEKAAKDATDQAASREELAKKTFRRNYLAGYLPYADNGNEEAREALIYEVYNIKNGYCHCDLTYMLPNMQRWMKEAIKKNNFNIISLVGLSAIYGNSSYNLGLTQSQGLQLMEKAVNTNVARKGYLSVRMQGITPELVQQKKLATTAGIYIIDVTAGGSASLAGLTAGDIILKADGKTVLQSADLTNLIQSHQAGDKVQIEYVRDGQNLATTATLGAAPDGSNKADAMIVMANYYNAKRKMYGGEDAEKALAWYTKAAENGSPNAMYALAKIYMNGLNGDKAYYVKYKVLKDEKLAFEWLQKAIADSEYPESVFQTHTKSGAHAADESYTELIKMYRNGIGCERSETKANELQARLDNLLLDRKLSEN